MRIESLKLRRQVVHVEGFRTGIEAQRPRAAARARVKVDLFREPFQLASDAQGRVIDVEARRTCKTATVSGRPPQTDHASARVLLPDSSVCLN
jgi:hypothetical protein